MQAPTRNEEQATGTPLRTILLATDGCDGSCSAVCRRRSSTPAIRRSSSFRQERGQRPLCSNPRLTLRFQAGSIGILLDECI
jgi:hypothetical protein